MNNFYTFTYALLLVSLTLFGSLAPASTAFAKERSLEVIKTDRSRALKAERNWGDYEVTPTHEASSLDTIPETDTSSTDDVNTVTANGISAICISTGATLVDSDVIYASPNNIDLPLRIYRPDCPEVVPVIIWVQGGGFSGGEPKIPTLLAQPFTEAGYAIAVVTHRDKFDAPFPAQLFDLRGAVRYLRAHADELSLNTDHITVVGSSSGGILASLMGTTPYTEDYTGTVGGNLEFSSSVEKVILINGAYTLDHLTEVDASALSAVKIISGCMPQDPCPEIANMSPETYLNTADTPFLILHGLEDTTVLPIQSLALANSTNAVGLLGGIKGVPGVGHNQRDVVLASLEEMLTFLGQDFMPVYIPDESPTTLETL